MPTLLSPIAGGYIVFDFISKLVFLFKVVVAPEVTPKVINSFVVSAAVVTNAAVPVVLPVPPFAIGKVCNQVGAAVPPLDLRIYPAVPALVGA